MVAGFVMPFIFKMLSLGLDRCQGNIYSVTQLITQTIPLQPMTSGMIDCVHKGHAGFFQEQIDRMKMHNEKNLGGDKFSA